ncbi:MAG: Coenzyme F420 hydrogenase/dehydrogenase, beta subunit C-terminal domain [Ignavibacteriae bacterium]|nr:Coenzyme F420 hydrogenase/dehydrogenase, beta subunit C-terminal domain [Ignavibacteriota bacterium]
MNNIFNLKSDYANDLNKNNLSNIINIFKKNKISLSNKSYVITESESYKWRIIDNENKLDFILNLDNDIISISRNIHIVTEIVDKDLCVRCGACDPACPANIIKFDDQAFPYITKEEDCISNCVRCIKVCPGKVVDFNTWDDEMFGMRPHPESITGIVRKSMVGYSVNEDIREKGASGGIVTQLLTYMLDKKIIDGALVLSSGVDENGYHLKPMIARTKEDLRKAARSKYLLIPHLEQIREIENVEGNYAIVALPCHIHAIKKYQKVSKKLRERLKFIIGLYCNVAYEPYLLDDLIELSGYKKSDIINAEFRAGEWPGYIELTLRSGEVVRPFKFEEIKDAINSLKLFYTAGRCNLCIDFSAEYADISVGDPWLRGKDGNYLYKEGWTTILTRTEIGDEMIDNAVNDGYIKVVDLPLKTYMMNFEKNAIYKRNFVPKNINLRNAFNIPSPEYSRPFKKFKKSSYLVASVKIILLYFSRKSKKLRFLGVKFFQTGFAMKVFAWNRDRKKQDFSSDYSRMEKFVNHVGEKFIDKLK